jgi:hypothetical protein
MEDYLRYTHVLAAHTEEIRFLIGIMSEPVGDIMRDKRRVESVYSAV